ncbi:hypothetical protein OEA41_000678 [Lepraria neglecta]|uniref:Uncharacterized protein n=1 Tax=Lepraria neglecta TaxID=209136 RepID=A0AAE0DPP0_9LECA|nr:hypothetical protein OEA41_000678 [Lepraria neglecta]
MAFSAQFYRQGPRGSPNVKVRRICRRKDDMGNDGMYVVEVGNEKLIPIVDPRWIAEEKTVLDRASVKLLIRRGDPGVERWQAILDRMTP